MIAALLQHLDLDAGLADSLLARRQAGESLPAILEESTDARRVAEALAAVLGLPVILDPAELQPSQPWLQRIGVRVWAAARALPLVSDEGSLRVACLDPSDHAALETLRVACGGVMPQPVVVPSPVLRQVLGEQLGLGADTVQTLIEGRLEEHSDQEVDLAEAAEDASIIRLVNQVLMEALDRRATDVHFEPFEGRFAVRYRIDGVLVEARLPPEIRRLQAAIISRVKILAQLDIAEKRLPQDGRIKLRLKGREVDVRVSVIPMLHGEAVVLRLLDRHAALVGLEHTGMAGAHLDIYRDALQLPHGIILITGPTGSGKTTSLYAGLSSINTPDTKIITIEDPVEYHLDGINQIQVDGKTGLSFAKGLRAILRHDPDVVLIGEIRDRETAEIAVQASLTGHLVLSTLHTNDAPGAITRLVDMGIEPYLVCSTLELVIAQRLVRLLCPHCKQPLSGEPRDEVLRYLGDHTGAVFGPQGCRECHGSGYLGRCGIFEMMPMSDELRHLATTSLSSQGLRAVAITEGMETLLDNGLRLVRDGRSSLEEILRLSRKGVG
jgi:general secretion pathway protein E/type IV pilus assembly protein PilB